MKKSESNESVNKRFADSPIRRFAYLLIFLLLPVLAFPELIFGRQSLYWTDLSWIHYPRHIFAAGEWLAGRVPLWDPYENTGLPLLAETQVGVLYPLSVLFLSSLSASLELSLFILIHFSMAAVFTVILARSLEMGWASAVVAGLSFGFGGFLMSQVANLNIMTGAVWLPLILYAVMQTVKRRSWLVAMLAGLPLALQIFTAQPQIVFYTLVMIFGYGLYRVIADFYFNMNSTRHDTRYALHTGLLLGVAILSGLLLAAPQLLPTFELQQLSVRSEERGFDFLTKNSLPPTMWLNLLMPSAYGNNVTGFKGGDPFQEVFIYVGFIPLLLALFSWKMHHKRDMRFMLFMLIGAALLALGKNTPLYQYFIQYLPGFDLFRIPSRWLMVVNLALAILAGFGLESLLKDGLSRQALFILLSILLLMAVALGLIWGFNNNLLAWSDNNRLVTAFLNKGFAINPIYYDRLLLSRVAILTVPAFLLITNIVITALLLSLYASRRITGNSFAMLVIVAISLDLTIAGGTAINPLKPDGWWQQLSGGADYVLENLGEFRVFPLGMGSEEVAVSHLGQYFPSVHQVYSAGGHGSSLQSARYSIFLHEADPVQAIQVLGARYLLTLGQMGADVASTYPLAYSDEDSFVYENKTPLPRAFIVHDAIQANSPEEALSYFQSRTIDPRQTVIIEAKTALSVSTVQQGSDSTATISSQNPQMVEIEANLSYDGWLVLLDSYYPGWIATIDGQTTPIYRANYIGRAIFVPAGQYTIRFEYKPFSFKVGVWLSLFMLSLIIFNLLWIKNRVA